MRALKWMASLVITLEDDGKTKPECDKINHVNAFFIILYALLTGIFMWNLLSSDYRAVFDGAQSIYASNAGEKLGYLVIHYTLYMVSLASIHMWIYMARRVLWECMVKTDSSDLQSLKNHMRKSGMHLVDGLNLFPFPRIQGLKDLSSYYIWQDGYFYV